MPLISAASRGRNRRGSLPDLGAVELNQSLSTAASANNDVLTGTNAVNKLTGLAGADYLKGVGGNDTLEGGLESDLLDGGPGNDTLQGGLGLDVAAYPGAAGVIIDLSGTADTAKRGSEKDTLIGIEGALGSNAADTFKGDELNNEFQGKTGKDTMTGGAGRDTWDFNDAADSPAGATRDVVTDFVPGQDIIDLTGVDANGALPGNQSFRWVGKANLTGAAQLGYFVSGATTIVRASTDADAASELEIQFTGVKTPTAADFRP